MSDSLLILFTFLLKLKYFQARASQADKFPSMPVSRQSPVGSGQLSKFRDEEIKRDFP